MNWWVWCENNNNPKSQHVSAFSRKWMIAPEVFCWKLNSTSVKDSVNFCVSQRELEQCARRCHPFPFNRFHICRSGAGHNKELQHTRPFALLAIASLFNQVKNVRFQRTLHGLMPPLTTFIILLSLSLIVSEPKTTHDTFSRNGKQMLLMWLNLGG